MGEQQQHKIGPEEFAHAIKITTSVQLSETMVSVIYSIFDVDGDKNLTYKEIMSIMKSRLDRGMRAHMDNVKMDFPRCDKTVGSRLRRAAWTAACELIWTTSKWTFRDVIKLWAID